MKANSGFIKGKMLEITIPNILRELKATKSTDQPAVDEAVLCVLEEDCIETLTTIKNLVERPQVGDLGNSHVHLSAYGAIQNSIGEGVLLAWSEGLPYFAVNDFNTTEALERAKERSAVLAVPLIAGLELICRYEFNGRINDPSNPDKMYFCGKGLRQIENESFQRALQKEVIGPDQQRMKEMGNKLEQALESFGITGVTYDDIKNGFGPLRTQVQERDYAQRVQERIWEMFEDDDQRLKKLSEIGVQVEDVNDLPSIHREIRAQYLKIDKPAYVKESSYITFDRAKSLVEMAGGLPCYPGFIEKNTEFEKDAKELVKNIKNLGVHFVEFIPTRNTLEYIKEIVPILVQNGLYLFAGTEHNESANPNNFPTLIPKIGGKTSIPEDLLPYFNAGPLIAIAHQQIQPVVDYNGRINANLLEAARAGQSYVQRLTGREIPYKLG